MGMEARPIPPPSIKERLLKQIRTRLTYANVMSSLAVFLILGGATAFAAVKKVGANEIKANSIKTGKIVKEAVTAGKIKKNAVTESRIADGAVTTNKIANDAVTGDKVKESTLGEVPKANTANSASSAGNANSVNGQVVHKILFRSGENGGPQTILNAGGLLLTATCAGGNTTFTATTTKNDSSIYVNVLDDTNVFFHEDQESGEFDVGDTVDMLAAQDGNNDMSIFEYDAVDGSVVTGIANIDEDGALGGCRVTGQATSG